ncbi:MAG: thermonuclease family protein [Alphaproteobacteria bacterium]|nr:MAG: thermonuclease family protein [Alphaproteobacteria bacterium]
MLRCFLPIAAAGLALLGTPVLAQDVMPAPKRAPRTPVTSAPLLQAPQSLEGPAVALDGESLWIGEHEVRLFAVTAPPPYAPYGAQAMAALDEILAGKTFQCRVRDRARDGRLVAQCQGTGDVDPALEMIRKGLAVVSRSSVRSSDLGDTYSAAEQAARKAKIGLWEHDGAVAPMPSETTARDSKVEAAKEPRSAENPAKTQNASADSNWHDAIERYQVLLAAAIFLLGAMMVPLAMWLRRGWQERAERRILAAALRAELAAARQSCRQRAHVLMGGQAESIPGSLWPRLRSMVFDACISRMGMLGTDMMRRLMTVYGQMADFNAMRQQEQQTGMHGDPMAVARGLSVLADRIAVVLHELEAVESARGRATKPHMVGYSRQALLPAVATASADEQDTTSGQVTSLPGIMARRQGVARPSAMLRRLNGSTVTMVPMVTEVQDVVPEPAPPPMPRQGMFHPSVVAEVLETATPVPAINSADDAQPQEQLVATEEVKSEKSESSPQVESISPTAQPEERVVVPPLSVPNPVAYVPEATEQPPITRSRPTVSRVTLASKAPSAPATPPVNGVAAPSDTGLSDEAFQELLRSATAIRKDLKRAS